MAETTKVVKFTANLAAAVSSIQGQLAQLKVEAEELKLPELADRVASISNALAQIAPEE
jgi:hypothetical protein